MLSADDRFEAYVSNSLAVDLDSLTGVTRAKRVLLLSEAEQSCEAILLSLKDAYSKVAKKLGLETPIRFAIVEGGSAPCRVSRSYEGDFIVVVSADHYYLLMALILRIQHAPVMHKFLWLKRFGNFPNYTGMYLIDIVRDIMRDDHYNKEFAQFGVYSFAFDAAFTTMIAHEIAHIAHGHLDFKASADFRQFIEDENSKWLTSRALEMDADSSAITSAFDIIGSRIPRMVEDYEGDKPSLSLALARQMHFGIFMSVIFTDAVSNNFDPKGHLPGYSRYVIFHWLCEFCLQGQSVGFSDTPELTRQAIADTFAHLSGSLANLHYPIVANYATEPDAPEPLAFYIPESSDEFENRVLAPLRGRWAKIRPYLVKHLRGGNLAPPSAPPS